MSALASVFFLRTSMYFSLSQMLHLPVSFRLFCETYMMEDSGGLSNELPRSSSESSLRPSSSSGLLSMFFPIQQMILVQQRHFHFYEIVLDQLQTMYFPVALNFLYPLMTLSMALIKSFSVMALRRSRIANMPASVQTDRSSAPVVLGQRRPRSSQRMPFSTDMCLAWILKMCTLPSKSGRANSIFLSILPGLMRAGSKVSGLLVAIKTLMFPLDSKPSIWLTISNIVLCTSWSPPEPSSNLAPPIASTSSKKMMQAFLVLAIWKISRTILAPSPTYFWTNSEPMTLMKQASVLLATALAVRVLPVPGGPQRSTPLGGSMPKSMNFSGVSSGISTTSLNFSSCSLQPPISLQVTSGLSSTVIIVTVASILAGKGI